MPGRRRCKLHGGRSRRGHAGGDTTLAIIKRKLHQALRRAMGLPWYGGRPRKIEDVDRMTEKAIEIGSGALEVIETMVPIEREAEHAGELLLRGMQTGLMVGTDICEQYREMRQLRSFEQIDPKLIRLASDTAGWMCRLGAKVMEEAFRRRRDDTVGKLLEQLKISESKPE